MGLNIRYRSQCYKCKEWFEKGHAYLHRVKGKWMCHCMRCHQKSKAEKVKSEKAEGKWK